MKGFFSNEHIEKRCFVGKVFFFKLRWMGRLPGAATRCFSLFFVKVRLCFLAIVFEHLEKICFVGKVFFFQVEMDR